MFGLQNMSYNSCKNIFSYCSHEFPDIVRVTMLFTGQENLTYIPLSSFIILLVILLTCASRRKKIDTLSAVEQSMQTEMKGEYAILCFPCLRKRPNLKEFEPTADLSDQFEYIVEKYTIRKVPLLLANTAEDLLERQEELEVAMPKSQPQLLKDDFVNFQVNEIYNVQRVPPCYTIAANTGCPGSKVKERPKPADVLESMSPIRRPHVRNHNYVVIPTKGSLRQKDIMLTKREITNQYLNNFSSVFVDNLKDQVPKDPEQFPSLSRPYTSAFRNFAVPESSLKGSCVKKSKHSKNQKVAYAFPLEDGENKNEESNRDAYYDSDSLQEQGTDTLDSEFQADLENDTETESKVKSLVLMNDSDSFKDETESVANPFKTTIKSSVAELQDTYPTEDESEYQSPYALHKIDWKNNKNVTYEDIQALDVGYEFKSCEKLGVKPQMTRIHYPEPVWIKDSGILKNQMKNQVLGLGDSPPVLNKKFVIQEQPPKTKANKTTAERKPCPPRERPSNNATLDTILPPSAKTSSRSVVTDVNFPPKTPNEGTRKDQPETPSEAQNQVSESTLTTKSEGSKSLSLNDLDYNRSNSTTVLDSVAEISKLYDLSKPVAQQRTEAEPLMEAPNPKETVTRIPAASKSRSLHSTSRPSAGKEEVKGNDHLPYTNPCPGKSEGSQAEEAETETSCSFISHESKTSTVATTPRSSEVDDGKRATLRWKIVIKHHREDDSSRKNVNLNIKN